MLTNEQIDDNKKRFISLLLSTQREGMENVLKYLEENNFFNIPSSLIRHHNWEGGLAQHCLGVFDRLSSTGQQLPAQSVIITSLLHDICKAEKIYKDENGEWQTRKDEELKIPGHGERSVKILDNLGLELSDDERKAIRWHMGGWKIAEKPKDQIRDFFATKKSELWRLLYNADKYDASHHPNL